EAIGNGERSRYIRADEISFDRIVRADADRHSRLRVTGNDVARRRRRASDGVVIRVVIDRDAVDSIGDGDGASHIRADEVTLHLIVMRVDAVEVYSICSKWVVIVSRDDVARAGLCPADGVARSVDENSVTAAEPDCAGGVCADEVALDQVTSRAGTADVLRDLHAIEAVPGKDLARARRRAADDVVVRSARIAVRLEAAAVNQDGARIVSGGAAVSSDRVAGDSRADEIAADNVPVRTRNASIPRQYDRVIESMDGEPLNDGIACPNHQAIE